MMNGMRSLGAGCGGALRLSCTLGHPKPDGPKKEIE